MATLEEVLRNVVESDVYRAYSSIEIQSTCLGLKTMVTYEILEKRNS